MSSSNADRVAVPASQAQNEIPLELRNNIMSALLSHGGINNIENTLTHDLQRTGWLDKLKDYITDLFRSGECTSYNEAMAKAMEKVRRDALQANGTTNGVNGANGTNGNSHADEEVNLTIPNEAIRNGAKTVKKELERVCEIKSEDK